MIPLKGYIGPCDAVGERWFWVFGVRTPFFHGRSVFRSPVRVTKTKTKWVILARRDGSIRTHLQSHGFFSKTQVVRNLTPPLFLPRQNRQFPKNLIPCVSTDPRSQKSETPPERSATANYIESFGGMFVSMTWKNQIWKMFLEPAKSLISGCWEILIFWHPKLLLIKDLPISNMFLKSRSPMPPQAKPPCRKYSHIDPLVMSFSSKTWIWTAFS